MSVLNERDRMRSEAEAQPFNRGRLADRATRAGQALDETNQAEADKWFALAAEIRGMASENVVVSPPALPDPPAVVPAELTPVTFTPTEKQVYFDQHRDEILADRLSIGHGRTLTKWSIPLVMWMELKARWVKEGIVVKDLRHISRRSTSKEAIAEVKVGEKTEHTPTVREEHQKAILESEDTIEITVGRLEEILRELEEYRGYRKAILDVFGGKTEQFNDKS